MSDEERRKPPAMPITCTFVGGPLDGQRIAVAADQGCYMQHEQAEIHVYHRRSHPSAYRERDDRARVSPSPPLFDHQPGLTKPVGAK